jgi:branched-chain amino acid transport system ATP-binding protein
MNPGEVENLMTFIQWLGSEFKLAIWLIEHQMKLVMGICQRLTVIDFGRTLIEGKPEEVRNNPKVLEAYLGAPADGIV